MPLFVRGFVQWIFHSARRVVGDDRDGVFFGDFIAKRVGVVGSVGYDEIGLKSFDEGERLRSVAGLAGCQE